MVKKFLFGCVLALLITGIILVSILWESDTFQTAEVSEAVPSNTILFVDKIDYEFLKEDFRSLNLWWNELISNKKISAFDSSVQEFGRRIEKMPVLLEGVKNHGMSFSVHLLGNNKLEIIIYVKLEEGNSSQQIDHDWKSVFGNELLVNKRKYENIELTDISLSNTNAITGFSYGIHKGLFIASTSAIILEDAIRSLNSNGGIFHQEGFKKVLATAGKYVQANVYVNYSVIDQLFYPAVQYEKHAQLSSLNGMADWGEFDVEIRDNIFALNGMSYTSDSLKNWLNLFAGQSPVRLEASSFIPSNAVTFRSMGISDKALFKEKLRNELSLRGQFPAFQKQDEKLATLLGESPFNKIMEMLNNEVVKFTMDVGKGSGTEEIVMYELKSGTQAKEALENWISVLAKKNGKELNQFTFTYVLDEQTRFTLFNLQDNFYKGMVVGSFFKPLAGVYENYLIFGDSYDAISRVIYQNVLHKTLANEESFKEVNNLISTKANLTAFVKPDLFIEQHDDLLRKEVKVDLNQLKENIEKIPGLIIQFSNEDQMFYSNISFKYSSSYNEQAMTVWESLLDSTAMIKPELVMNHHTSEKDIFVQDKANTVCLLNSTGRILWRVKIDGKILSQIYQVDYYDNGKLQYLFSTSKRMYLIDRNGNNVEKFPVNFPSEASNGIALFDYDNRKEYRLFVACVDQKVYAYDLEGNSIPGWTFRKTEGQVHKPIQHFRISDKDYIVFSDPVRTYILDRRGQERIKIRAQKALSRNNLFYLDMNVAEDKPRFVTTDTMGNVIGIDLNGEMNVILEHTSTSDHFFRTKDLNQNGKKEYIFADKNMLEVLDLKGKRLFTFKIKNDISTLPDIYEFSAANLKIGLTDEKKNLIYLLNTDGTVYEGFPLEGNTRFTIGYFAGSDSRFNLIVGSNNGFLYNYSIE